SRYDNRVSALFEQPPGEKLIDAIVLDQKNPKVSLAFRQGRMGKALAECQVFSSSAGCWSFLKFEAQGEMECASLSEFAIQPDASAEQRDKIRRDCQTKAGSSVLPRC